MKKQFLNLCQNKARVFLSGSEDDFSSLEISPNQFSRIQSELGVNNISIHTIKQVHGNEVFVVNEANQQEISTADAAVTQLENTALSIRTADCLPVFLYDCRTQAVAVIHAGWRSTHKKIIEKTISTMKEQYDSVGEDIIVFFGAAIQKCCYEVGNEFVDFFPEHVAKDNQKYYLDLAGVNRQELIGQGVLEENIVDQSICTCCNHRYHSYRRDGERAGRNISLIILENK